MFITGISTAAPPHRCTQEDCWTALRQSLRFRDLKPRSKAVLKKVLEGDNGIAARHFAIGKLDQAFEPTPDALHARFVDSAPGGWWWMSSFGAGFSCQGALLKVE